MTMPAFGVRAPDAAPVRATRSPEAVSSAAAASEMVSPEHVLGAGGTPDAVGARRLIPQLTGIRSLAALWVALFHFRPYDVEAFPQSWPLLPLANVGHLGVDLFFVLSGFILTFTHLDRMVDGWGPRKMLGFLWLRLSRVWPVTMAMLVVYGLYRIGQTWGTGEPGFVEALEVRPLLLHILLVQSWGTEHHNWNPIDWSISAEWLAYIVFTVAVLGLARIATTVSTRGIVLLAGLALLPMVLIGLTMEDGSDLMWSGGEMTAGIVPLRVLTEFLAGAFVALVVMRVGPVRRLPLLLRPTTVMIAIVAIIYLLQRFDPHERLRFGQEWLFNGHSLWGPTESVIVVPLFAVLIGGLALTSRGLSRVLATRALVWGGKVSFAFYLVHWFCMDVMLFTRDRTDLLDDPDGWAWKATVVGTLLAAVLAGWLLYRFVEEPSRRGMRRMLPASIKV
jgi:peptidoglycan/LPS O-acetylase OafA/YrhL